MALSQLCRLQIWLEHLLSPLSRLYGSFECIRDSTDFMFHLENVKTKAINEDWDWNKMIVFPVDIKALYPSVKFECQIQALKHCSDKHTSWTDVLKKLLIELIMYILDNQCIYWDSKFSTFNQGIPTEHSVLLANILLTYILLFTFESDEEFRCEFINIIKLWKRS